MARCLAGARDYKVQLVPDKGGTAVGCWSELCALGSGAAGALGLASLLEEWMEKTVPLVISDSSSALHIAKERGPGKVDHVGVRFLELQQWREQGRLHSGKVCMHSREPERHDDQADDRGEAG
eukprot:4416589-Pyramimonas_sp.AAC.1